MIIAISFSLTFGFLIGVIASNKKTENYEILPTNF